jgi:DNA (cytosine-5)-methyltransferase 1
MNVSIKNKPVVIDLFAGCGGLSLGLEQAGFYPIFVNELNQDAMASYLINRKRLNSLLMTKYNTADIKNFVLKKNIIDDLIDGFKADYRCDAKKGEIDLVAGGPPCQGYSGIGHRRSYSVDKKQLPSNFLYQDMAYFINKVRPKIFLFENVKGLLSSRWSKVGEKGEIWDHVLKTFREIPGYIVRYDVVYAKDYGVPQNRPRVLLVGIREDLGVNPEREIWNNVRLDNAVECGFLPEKSRIPPPNLVDLMGDLVDPKFKYGGVTTRYPKQTRTSIQEELRINPDTGEVLGKGDILREQEYSNHSENIVKKFQYMLKNNGQIPISMKTKKFAQRVLPARWQNGGPSITATSLADDYVHFSQARSLTVRELARIQMFPDWYEFMGKRTTGGLRRAGNPQKGLHDREVPKYTQIGNAVPVKLAKKIGEHFIKLLS